MMSRCFNLSVHLCPIRSNPYRSPLWRLLPPNFAPSPGNVSSPAHVSTWFGAPWSEVLTGIGTVMLALVTVLATWLTISRANAATVQARQDAADERARASEQRDLEESRKTAAGLARYIASAWSVIAIGSDEDLLHLGRLNLELALDAPALRNEELASRVREVQTAVQALISFRAVIPDDGAIDIDGADRASMLRRASMYQLALGFQVRWVRDSLTACRVGLPLPPRPTSSMSVLPTLNV
jgi:hypothetical protein